MDPDEERVCRDEWCRLPIQVEYYKRTENFLAIPCRNLKHATASKPTGGTSDWTKENRYMAVEQESPLEFWRSEYQRAYGAPFVKVSAKLQTALRSAAKPVQQPIAETVQPAVEVQRPPSRQTAAPQLQVVAASVDEASQVPEPNPVSVASESVPHHRDNTQKAKASKAGKTKRDIYNYGVGNTRPANYGNYMKTFNIGAPKSQVSCQFKQPMIV